ncbi:hypothetical protein CBR_g3309 [Chara braunii]|uniref:Uncharacterized protein n=1 Tax=Chara braunii TaxID=69332 RepID=A0A388KFE6_CHABU|nr:hypothetical protein CBR_g3309 [Chara braunii]|eukprot:GBG68769.1 hypothetical protein CBR_g3309 [Chara braunii]
MATGSTCATLWVATCTTTLSTGSFARKEFNLLQWPKTGHGTNGTYFGPSTGHGTSGTSFPSHLHKEEEGEGARFERMARSTQASSSYSLRVLPHGMSRRVPCRLSPVPVPVPVPVLSPASGARFVTLCRRTASQEANRESAGRLAVRTMAVAGGETALDIAVSSVLDALVFDCDGVILESEDLHRRAYNATFSHFDVRCPSVGPGEGTDSEAGSGPVVAWTTAFYDVFQNKVGGGKPKMRWYFREHGWPTSTIFPSGPQTDDEKVALIDTLQDWKTAKYKDLIGSGEVLPRPGILQLMDEARALGLKIAVCSAATKSSVIFCLESLLGKDRFDGLDCFLAGDDVDKKKPDPKIYNIAAKMLNVAPDRCLVIEDSVIGLQAAMSAGMRCIITHTSSTKDQNFDGASAVFEDLGTVTFRELLPILQQG